MNMFGIYIIETPEDALVCANAAIYDFVIGDVECENCAMAIGALDDVFVPCSVITDTSGDAWPVCIDCIAPMIFPGD